MQPYITIKINLMIGIRVLLNYLFTHSIFYLLNEYLM